MKKDAKSQVMGICRGVLLTGACIAYLLSAKPVLELQEKRIKISSLEQRISQSSSAPKKYDGLYSCQECYRVFPENDLCPYDNSQKLKFHDQAEVPETIEAIKITLGNSFDTYNLQLTFIQACPKCEHLWPIADNWSVCPLDGVDLKYWRNKH